MPDTGGVLGRWARLKAAARQQPPPTPAPTEAVETPELPLPPLESLGTASDYTAFLQNGVAAEIQQAALRRAWETDAVIAGFRGMADYDWDFNAPSYGKLRATDDVAKLLRAVLSPPPAPPDPHREEQPTGEPGILVAAAPPETAVTPASPAQLPAPEGEAGERPDAIASGIRRHGSALPC